MRTIIKFTIGSIWGTEQMNVSFSSTTKRIMAAVVTAAMLIVVLLSGLYIILEADHDCSGEDCHICECLENCQAVIHQTGSAPVSNAAVAVTLFFLASVCVCAHGRTHRETPVSDKVQLNI